MPLSLLFQDFSYFADLHYNSGMKFRLNHKFSSGIVLSIFLFFAGVFLANAQNRILQIRDLSQLKVNSLSEEQIKAFDADLKSKGITLETAEQELRKRNLPNSEIEELKKRLGLLEPKVTSTKKAVESSRASEESLKSEFESALSYFRSPIFGAELFSTSNLSFEPNLRIASPANYQLGPDDEVIVDLSGFSEETHALKVSPDGFIRLPLYGPVQVNGTTLEAAKVRIRNKIAQSNPSVANGQTQVMISLGKIRSIRVYIVGEVVKPGTYTLPSLAGLFNALYASGGPGENGSFRDVQLVRNNKVIARLDVYDFLMKGYSKADIRLQDNDLIRVGPIKNRVEMKGYVNREGFFEIKQGESLTNLLEYAGGFQSNAYKERIKVERKGSKQQSVADIPSSLFESFQPKNGDIFLIDSILNRYENRVQISGAVFRPGYYALNDNPTVKALVSNAEGIKEDAFTGRAIIYRLKDDNSQEMISLELDALLTGKIADIPLKREDKLIIASKLEMMENRYVQITGQVLYPGWYPYAESMKLEDLIVAAGGLKEAAELNRVLVARRVDDADRKKLETRIADVSLHEVDVNLKDKSNYLLKPFDMVTVFARPGYLKQKTVFIEGEVLYPGTYALENSRQRISDIVEKSGGLTANSFPEGAILIRRRDNSLTGNIILENKIRALRKQSKDTADLARLIAEERARNSEVVGIDLNKIIEKKGSKYDLLLNDSDIVRIPYLRQTISVSGEILFPARLRFEKGEGFRSYISKSGGFSSRALRRRAYVVYPNGTAKATKNFVLFKVYPKVLPGSELVVPMRDETRKLSTIEIVTMATTLTSTLVILSNFIKF